MAMPPPSERGRITPKRAMMAGAAIGLGTIVGFDAYGVYQTFETVNQQGQLLGQYQDALDQKDQVLEKYEDALRRYQERDQRLFGQPPSRQLSEESRLSFGPTILNRQFFEKPDQQDTQPLFQQAKDLFHQQTQFLGDRISDMEVTDDTLQTAHRSYDLNNPSDFAFASAIIRVRFSHAIEGDNPVQKYAKEAEQDIEWLADNISFVDKNSAPFVNPTNLIVLSRILQNLDSSGKPYPRQWCRSTEIVGYNSELQTATLDAYDEGNSRASYALAQYYYRAVPDVAQGYVTTVQAKRTEIAEVKYPELLSVYRGSRNNTEAEFLETMALFLQHGESFRRKIAFANLLGQEGKVLQAKYDYLAKMLGFETSVDARSTIVESFAPGELVQVVDHLPELSGDIHLAEEPTPRVLIGGQTVRHGDVIKIIDGPTTVLDYSKREAFRMYRIRKGNIEEVIDDIWIPTPGQVQGWLSGMWMQKIAPNVTS